MRRITALSTLVAVATMFAPHASARMAPGPGAGADLSNLAFASDNVRIGKHLYLYFGGGYDGINSAGKSYSRGFAGRGRCFTFKRKQIKLTICMATAKSRKIADEDFVFDPALQSASLSLSGPKGKTELDWTGKGRPEPGASPAADPSYGAFAWADLYRNARARGKILGRKIPLKGFSAWSFLDEGAMAYASSHGSSTTVWTSPGGLVHIRTVRRVRL
jgi:hypothetical protein